MQQWRSKLTHFLILSSAGKPIYSRHGDDQLITNYIGVVQTIISFYQSTDDSLRGFTAGDVRFVVMSRGPLNLVAISRLAESDAQLRGQLEALYMQILSTLTLPSMERMFAARANYDLRRPLQGTETLLSALADGFTRGSSSTLLSALECLKLRKSHRTNINNSLLKTRSENLLYGLIVASGKLVSVVRPKKHSLHPGDLHLIFNMLFEAGSVKAGGGENWIPLCLPGFNNTGYLYMYVSFLNLERPTEPMQERPRTSEGADDEVAVLLISAEKESFFELRRMRDELVEVCTQSFFSLHLYCHKFTPPYFPVSWVWAGGSASRWPHAEPLDEAREIPSGFVSHVRVAIPDGSITKAYIPVVPRTNSYGFRERANSASGFAHLRFARTKSVRPSDCDPPILSLQVLFVITGYHTTQFRVMGELPPSGVSGTALGRSLWNASRASIPFAPTHTHLNSWHIEPLSIDTNLILPRRPFTVTPPSATSTPPSAPAAPHVQTSSPAPPSDTSSTNPGVTCNSPCPRTHRTSARPSRSASSSRSTPSCTTHCTVNPRA